MIPARFEIIRLLGKGKSGRSYLVKCRHNEYVLKEMHNEQVPYYQFTKPKIELEIDAHAVLVKQKIKIPKMIEYDLENSYILKEYVKGQTITELIRNDGLDDSLILEMLKWERDLKNSKMNIDYFPSNFVYNGMDIYYVDYEYNTYSEEWNFSNWGIYYWLNADGFRLFIETDDPRYINEEGTGIPVKNERIIKERERILKCFG